MASLLISHPFICRVLAKSRACNWNYLVLVEFTSLAPQLIYNNSFLLSPVFSYPRRANKVHLPLLHIFIPPLLWQTWGNSSFIDNREKKTPMFSSIKPVLSQGFSYFIYVMVLKTKWACVFAFRLRSYTLRYLIFFHNIQCCHNIINGPLWYRALNKHPYIGLIRLNCSWNIVKSFITNVNRVAVFETIENSMACSGTRHCDFIFLVGALTTGALRRICFSTEKFSCWFKIQE